MARQMMARSATRAEAWNGGLGATGFLAACAALMAALAVQVPMTGPEAIVVAHGQAGLDRAMPIPRLTDLAIWTGALLLPQEIALRGPFVLATVSCGVVMYRLALRAGVGPIAACLSLAWCFSSAMVLAGGVLTGAGPLAMLAVTISVWAVLRLVKRDKTEDWGLVWATTSLAVYAAPALVPMLGGIAVAPLVVPPVRRWLLRPGFWIVLSTPLFLLLPAAQINGSPDLARLWPVIHGEIAVSGGHWMVMVLATPALICAVVFGIVLGPGSPRINPERALLWLLALGGVAGTMAAGAPLELAMALMPILCILGADAVLSRQGRLATWLAEHTLPMSVALMLVGLVLWATSAPILTHRLPALRDGAGWTRIAVEIEALAAQNDVQWVVTDRAEDAAMLSRAFLRPLPALAIGITNGDLVDCSRPGMYLALGTDTNRVMQQFRGFRNLEPVTRLQDGQPLQVYGLYHVDGPVVPGICRLSDQ